MELNLGTACDETPEIADCDTKSILKLRTGTANGVEWKLYEGNALCVLKRLPALTYNCVVTSPPYYWLRDYGMDAQIGKEQTVEEYIDALSLVMDEVYRVLRGDGVLFINIGDTYYSGKGESKGSDRKSNKRRFGLRAVDKSGGLTIGLQRKSMIGVPWRLVLSMLQRKWILRSTIIWHRDRCLPEPVKDRPRRSHEYIFMFVKERKYYFDRQPLIEKNIDEDVWTIPARPKISNTIDTAPYPDELVQRCLDIGCPQGGNVLDCFVGSGTTMRVAINSKMPVTGIELNPEYCEYIENEMQKLQEMAPCF